MTSCLSLPKLVGFLNSVADLRWQPRAQLQTFLNRKRQWHLACVVHSVLRACWQALPLLLLLFQINPRNILSHVWHKSASNCDSIFG